MELVLAAPSFISALLKENNNLITTANSAHSNKFVDPSSQYEGRLGLFYKSVRGVNNTIFTQYLDKALNENYIDAVVLAYHIRDCRGGKGERDIGRKALIQVLAKLSDNDKFKRLVELIAEYGRWDDLVVISGELDNNYKKIIYDLLWNQLNKDRDIMNSGQPGVSLCAKWLPSEDRKHDKNIKFVSQFTNHCDIRIRTYRKNYLTPLRRYINIVENLICSGKWSQINYNAVPSCAMNKLKNAFMKHDPTRYTAWIKSLKTGKTKVNAGQLFPNEIIYSMLTQNNNLNETLCDAQFNELIKKYGSNVSFKRTLVVCDTSGSMYSGACDASNQPIYVSIGLSLLITKLCDEPFKNKVISFSANPTLVDVSDGPLRSRFEKLNKECQGFNTNLAKVWDLILKTAVNHRIKPEDMPNRVIILSDMQFDAACPNYTNHDYAVKLYASSGYKLPTIVYWNLNGRYNDFPITTNDKGILISGFSPSILKYILEDKEYTPLTVLNEVLQSDRYKVVRSVLE
jgi:hypothetical protein